MIPRGRVWKIVKTRILIRGKQYLLIRIWDIREREWIRDKNNRYNIHEVLI